MTAAIFPKVVYCAHLHNWLRLLIGHAYILRSVQSERRAPKAVVGVAKPVEALALVEYNLPDAEWHHDAIESRFEITDVRVFTGTTPELIDNVPEVWELVRTRYSALVRMTTFFEDVTLHAVLDTFKH
ncbi:uncharacterized protein LDX57_008626 [Aspergillus melleus]|uniref:uncharacterized protein n=1 Tax=Aspergillus melleus TaxID=138277 RepID=UPI001E8CFAC7|nr:uncharacterized protein LDX57_008626 [Aspergillus melleus]KAH8430964.1 hypothetical protein LDX57_008626 [Aspergillus melleus]